MGDPLRHLSDLIVSFRILLHLVLLEQRIIDARAISTMTWVYYCLKDHSDALPFLGGLMMSTRVSNI